MNSILVKDLERVDKLVKKYFVYKSENKDTWTSFHNEVLKAENTNNKSFRFDGDCWDSNTEIMCVDTNSNIYIKRISDVLEGEKVLAYDFETSSLIIDTVIKSFSSGDKFVSEVVFNNTQTVLVSDKHPFWKQSGRTKGKFIKGKLEFSRNLKSNLFTVPFLKNVPYSIVDNISVTEDYCFVVGHFLAEGWNSKDGKSGTSGYNIYELITPKLDNLGIKYSTGKNGNGCPTLNFLKKDCKVSSDFVTFLKTLKTNSFSMRLPDWFLDLPKNKLQAFCDGYFSGDGHIHNHEVVYSTSCKEFSDQLCLILRRLGNWCKVITQENHGGSGNQPIYRVTVKNYKNTKSVGVYGNGFDKFNSYVKEIRPVGIRPCWDITTTSSSFILSNGMIGHNCDDLAITCLEILVKEGFNKRDLGRAIVDAYPNGRKNAPEGHMVAIARVGNQVYYFGDTFGPPTPISKRNHDIKLVDWLSDRKKWMKYDGPTGQKPVVAVSSSAMQLGRKGEDLIKHFESLRLDSYLCQASVWTIGWGHTKTAKPGMRITRTEAQRLFNLDIAAFVASVNRAIKVDITQDQFDALVSLAFNIGIGAFERSTLVRKINAKAPEEEVLPQIRRWVFAAGKRSRGLARRREAEVLLYQGLPWKVSATEISDNEKSELEGYKAEVEYTRHESDDPVRNSTVLGVGGAGVLGGVNELIKNSTQVSGTLQEAASELTPFQEYVPIVTTGISILMAAALVFVVISRINKIRESRR